MARILSRRADGAPAPLSGSSEASPADQPTVVVPASDAPEEVVREEVAGTEAAAEQPTVVTPAAAPPTPEAEADGGGADAGPGHPSFRERGRMRRRLRYLRRVREIGFRDLGGLVFDLDRFGRERPDLVQVKLEGLRSIDGELRALEVALDDVRPVEELDEPGISACLHCGALHGSEARFCPACGTAVGTAPFASVALPAAAPESPPAAEDEPAGEAAGTVGDPAPGDPAPDAAADPEQPRP